MLFFSPKMSKVEIVIDDTPGKVQEGLVSGFCALLIQPAQTPNDHCLEGLQLDMIENSNCTNFSVEVFTLNGPGLGCRKSL